VDVGGPAVPNPQGDSWPAVDSDSVLWLHKEVRGIEWAMPPPMREPIYTKRVRAPLPKKKTLDIPIALDELKKRQDLALVLARQYVSLRGLREAAGHGGASIKPGMGPMSDGAGDSEQNPHSGCSDLQDGGEASESETGKASPSWAQGVPQPVDSGVASSGFASVLASPPMGSGLKAVKAFRKLGSDYGSGSQPSPRTGTAASSSHDPAPGHEQHLAPRPPTTPSTSRARAASALRRLGRRPVAMEKMQIRG